jgi:ATP-binding cassette subfamily C (CFTR/MRP) protein 4
VDQLKLRYDPDLPWVLNGLSFDVPPGCKVGVVGRTGAGKSSLISAFFRLTDWEGGIKIDGVNIQDIGLQDLRSKISSIPQEPYLFSGTVRRNLDPFGVLNDQDMLDAIAKVQLDRRLEKGLDESIDEGSTNFSVGERQLLCLARAIVRKDRLLVLDEATANVDHQTDALIQATIRNEFKESTVFVVAHRLNTIIDSDLLIVMDRGRVVEADSPHQLLNDPNTTFSKMVNEVGGTMASELRETARQAHLSQTS